MDNSATKAVQPLKLQDLYQRMKKWWTRKELKILRRLLKEGKTNSAQIARTGLLPKRSRHAIYKKIKRVRLRGEKPVVDYWTKKEIKALFLAVMKEKLTATQIAASSLIKRKASNIQEKIQDLGLPRKERLVILWTARELWILRKLVLEKKMKPAEIAKSGLLSRHSHSSIQSQIRMQQLCDPQTSLRAKNAKRMNPAQRQELEEFLCGKGRETPSIEVAEKFGIKPRVVWYYREKLGLKLTKEQALSSKAYKESCQKKVPAFKTGKKTYLENLWKNRRELMLRRYRELEARGRVMEQKVCAKCHELWFATAEFFYPYRVKSKGGEEYQGFFSFCRACGLPWKRKKSR